MHYTTEINISDSVQNTVILECVAILSANCEVVTPVHDTVYQMASMKMRRRWYG